MKTIRLCPGCGAALAPDAPAGLCPPCLLKSDRPTLTVGATNDHSAARPKTVPGQVFGAYRILRLLGQGGMGEVFEAEDAETGRRVALKVLRHAPDSPTARQRFLREGRLAASVNHPNSVYIYGAEEIEGTPVITMEYVSGGTLQARVKRDGPMPVSEAVDAILQIIAGLEAAGDKGVLHRDVKPSNCFVEADGTVKVGDFGLSISTLARDQTALTMAGAIMGTPEYASPEQLRGDELDTRSDIYSVGVTLYYLLTGKPPFHGENMVGLIATVLDKPAPPPRTVRPEIPKGVEQIVLRCLAKQPQQRFKNYGQLREALLPFGSTAPTPATLGMRSVAGIIDTVLWMFLEYTWGLLPFYQRGQLDPREINPVNLGLTVLYYAVLEGFWGISFGKWICRLRVVGPNRNPPGFPRALARALLFFVVPYLPLLCFRSADLSMWSMAALSILMCAASFLLFVSARRRNGFAGLHDLVTGTRVIELAAYEGRPKLAATDDSSPHTSDAPTIGPFHVLDSLARRDNGEILLGYDTRLLRKVWIHKQPPGAAPVATRQRDLTRKGRLHWLASRRSETECWDAYEALTGQPLVDLLQDPQPWKSVRYWLHDLAEELEAARVDGSWPDALELNRVWITAEGRARLLDFPAPGAQVAVTPVSRPSAAEPITPPIIITPQLFLGQVAQAALSGRGLPAGIHTVTPQIPLPVSARDSLKTLLSSADTHTSLMALRPLLDKPAAVSRARRLALLSGCFLPAFVVFGTLWFGQETDRIYEQNAPGVVPLHACLTYLRNSAAMHSGTGTNAEHNAMQVYVTSRFRPLITNETFWSNQVVQFLIPAAERQLAEKALADHPSPGEAEIGKAKELLKSSLPEPVAAMPWQEMWLWAVGSSVMLACLSLLYALVDRRGHLLRVLGIEIVTRHGLLARRWRTFLRSLLTWLPALSLGAPAVRGSLWGLLPLLVIIGGAVYAIRHPERGIPDRLAGTWLVPK